MPVHQAGQHQLSAMGGHRLGRGGGAFADRGDGLAPHGDIAAGTMRSERTMSPVTTRSKAKRRTCS